MQHLILKDFDFANIANLWLATSQIAPNTRTTYAAQIVDFHDFMVSKGLVFHELNSMWATQYSDKLAWEVSEGTLAASTAALRIAACKSLFKFAADKQIGIHIFSHVRSNQEHTKVENLKKQAISYENFLKVIEYYSPQEDTAAALRNRALLYLTVATGARISEVLGLKMEHIVIEDNMITCKIKGKGDRFYSSFLPPVPCDSTPAKHFLKWFNYRQEEKEMGIEDPGFVFCSVGSRSAYQKLTTTATNRIITTPLRAMGLYDGTVTFHSLRHFYGELTTATEGLHAAQQLMRHTSQETTKRYAKEAVKTQKANAQNRVLSYFD